MAKEKTPKSEPRPISPEEFAGPPAFEEQDTLFRGSGSKPDLDLPLLGEGQILAGRFEIVRFLGRGGMGEVYEAKNTLQGTRVALKTLNAEVGRHPQATKLFLRKVELAQRITHPNISRVHDIFSFASLDENGHEVFGYFLTMELLEGESLAKYLADHGSIPFEEALAILRPVAQALDAAHAEGVVHLDLKPGNIIFVERLGKVEPIVMDFGLATLVDQTSDRLRDFTYYAGTVNYMAPELFRGKILGQTPDIYSLGLVTLEMLTGQTAKTGLDVLPARTRNAIARCLDADPAARFKSASDFVAALEGRHVNARASRGSHGELANRKRGSSIARLSPAELPSGTSLWQLMKAKFGGYFRWTAFAMLLTPIAVWIARK